MKRFALFILLALLASCSSTRTIEEVGEIYRDVAMLDDRHRNPVIVIPGILGSKLKETTTGTSAWGAFSGSYADPDDPAGARLVALPMEIGKELHELKDNVGPAGALDKFNIDLAGLPTPDAHTGRSLASLVRGEDVSDWRTDFLCEFLAVPGSIPRWEGVRGADWVYARYYVNGANKPPFEFLHDLKNDPDQLNNLALNETNSPSLKQMRARCDELIAETGPAMKDVGGVQRASGRKK